jgi:hypothetical protein
VCAIGRDDAGELTVFVTAFLGGLTTPTQTSNAAPRTLTDDVPFSARRPDGRTLFLLVPAKWCELDASGEVLFKPEAAQCLDRVQAMAQQVRDKPSRA